MLTLEIQRIIKRKEYAFVVLVLFGTMILDFGINCYRTCGSGESFLYGAYMMTVLENMSREPLRLVFTILLPIISSIIASDIYILDCQNNINTYLYTRYDRKLIIINQACAIFIVCFCTMFVILSLNLLLCIISFPLYGNEIYKYSIPYAIIHMESEGYEDYKLFARLGLNSPYINLMFFILMRGVLSGIFALVSYGASFIKKMNRYSVCVSSFVIYACVDITEEMLDKHLSGTSLSKLVYSGIFNINPNGNIYTYLKDMIFYLVLAIILIVYGIKREDIK